MMLNINPTCCQKQRSMVPRTSQDPPTWSQDSPKATHFGAKLAPRPSILEPRWPRWPQDPPFLSQDGPKVPYPGAKMAPRPPILEPRWPQGPPSWSKDGPKTPQIAAKRAQDSAEGPAPQRRAPNAIGVTQMRGPHPGEGPQMR